MPVLETIRAWKDEEYLDTLTAEQRTQVPEHPAGTIDVQAPGLGDEGPFGPFRVRQGTFGPQCRTNQPHC